MDSSFSSAYRNGCAFLYSVSRPQRPAWGLLNNIYAGWTYMVVGQEELGNKLLREVIRKHQKVFWPFDFLARFYLIRRRMEEARPLYKTILTLAPDNPAALNNAGVFFSIDGDLARAREIIKRAVEIAPNFSLSYSQLCSLSYQSGDMAKALELSEDLTARFPKDVEVMLARGQLLFAGEKRTEVDALSLKLVSLFAEDPIALDFRARVLLRDGKIDALEPLARTMIEEFDESPRGYNLLAAVLLRTDRKDEALKIQEVGLSIVPDDPETLWCATQVAMKAGASGKAETWRARFDALDVARYIGTAPIGQRWDKLFWLKDGMGLHPDTPSEERELNRSEKR